MILLIIFNTCYCSWLKPEWNLLTYYDPFDLFSNNRSRFYDGTAHAGEYINIVREPHNPYDGNAIRVDNLQGEKVGHIKRELAAILAPFMDKYSSFNDSSSNDNSKNATVTIGLSLTGTIPYPGDH